MTTKRFSLNMSEEMYNKVEENAKRRSIPMSAVVIFALEKYFQEDTVMPVLENAKFLLEATKQLEKKQSKKNME